jgi:hypothetical protein
MPVAELPLGEHRVGVDTALPFLGGLEPGDSSPG